MLLLLSVAFAEEPPLEDQVFPLDARLTETPVEFSHAPQAILFEAPLEDLLMEPPTAEPVAEPVAVLAMQVSPTPAAPELDSRRTWMLDVGLRAENTYEAGYVNGVYQARHHPSRDAHFRGFAIGAVLPGLGIPLAKAQAEEVTPRLPVGRWSSGSDEYQAGCIEGYRSASLNDRREAAQKGAKGSSIIVGGIILLLLL